METAPWVTFCMSTYKRPVLLHQQLACILRQTFPAFEIVISDNDPEASAKDVAAAFQDKRIRYFHNEENLGMIKSFNKSIDRSETDYIVMITDDDPVEPGFLDEIAKLNKQYPNRSFYGGCIRKNETQGNIEIIEREDFIAQLLDMKKTPVILWSSCVVKKETALQVGKIPDFGSPHLADHAFLAMCGNSEGGIIVNKMYSNITIHDTNFSKFNFHYYTSGCKGFYETMRQFSNNEKNAHLIRKAVIGHLGTWFITNMFNLKKYYTLKKDELLLKQVNDCITEIIHLPFMKRFMARTYAKNLVFNIKKGLNLL